MTIGLTKMSSRGQIVIPQDMRENFNEGDKVFIIKEGNNLLLKSESSMEENLLEDLEFARRTEEAYKEIEAGKGIQVKIEDLDKVMDSW